jgi:Flp pilus assembly protein TadG
MKSFHPAKVRERMKTKIKKINREKSGQALVELPFAFLVLCVFVFGIIDFGRAIYDVEVMKNLIGEGSSMASRGVSLGTTAQTVANYAGSDINLSTQGCVMVTSVTNNSGSLQVTGQASQGGIACTSKVGCLNGQGSCGSSSATLPTAASTALLAEPTGSSLYVTEIYYTYHTVTPIAALLGKSMPSQFYSVAYY